jgi:thiosulfate/3-mercaptopyruvate sulfurtransferase
MNYTTIVPANVLRSHLDDPEWVIIDCRYSLEDPGFGEKAYLEAHIPGAIFAHLDEQLSGTIIPGKTSRHPLPTVDEITQTFSNWGIDEQVQVIGYDDRGGGIAARLWWLLRWLGHDHVAVLDGGWSNWVSSDHPTNATRTNRDPRTFVPRNRSELLIEVDEVVTDLSEGRFRLLDSRSPERYRGEEEPYDSVAGHIPGAVSCYYALNLDEEGYFLPADKLRARFKNALGEYANDKAVFYCGSGVTGAHNVIAYLHAGLGDAKLYAGSWSEWITDSRRPISPKP